MFAVIKGARQIYYNFIPFSSNGRKRLRKDNGLRTFSSVETSGFAVLALVVVARALLGCENIQR